MAIQEIPVYFFTGFMDSGKTSLVQETLFENDFAEGNEHGNQCAKMKQNGKHGAGFAGVAGKILHQGQMTGAAHRQELCQSLYDTLKQGIPNRHMYSSFYGSASSARGEGASLLYSMSNSSMIFRFVVAPAAFVLENSGDNPPDLWKSRG